MKKIYINGDFITLENKEIEAIITENDKIKKCGLKDEILKEMDGNTKIIDLNGNTIMPSFIDAHSHIFALAKQLLSFSIDNLTSIEEILNKMVEYRKENKIEDWLIVNGYDYTVLKENRNITKQELDKLFPDIPVIIENKSRHNGIVNSKALEKLQITKDTKDPVGGKILYETGYLEEDAFIKALKKVPLPNIKNIIRAFSKAQKIYASYGITTAQEGVITAELAQIYKLLAENNEIFLDLIGYMEKNQVEEIKKILLEHINRYKNNLKISGIKIFLDGSLQARTAWLRAPYMNEENYCGYGIMENNEIEKIIQKCKEENLQILAHCNGDKASDQYINVIKQVGEVKRPVMIHAQTLALDQLEYVKKYDIIPSFFIGHVYYWGDTHIKNLGLERAEHISPAYSSLKKNILFTFHQDTPVTAPNMFETIWCAVNRRTRNGIELGKEEVIPVLDAIKAVTINSAYQYGEDGIKGSIKEGKKANLIIVNKNPLKIDKNDIKNIKILETIKDGKSIYNSNVL